MQSLFNISEGGLYTFPQWHDPQGVVKQAKDLKTKPCFKRKMSITKAIRTTILAFLLGCNPEPKSSPEPCPIIERICNLEALYLGKAGSVEEVQEYLGKKCSKVDSSPDFPATLEAMWAYKIKVRANGNKAAQEAAEQKVKAYRLHPRQMSLEEYVQLANAEAEKVQAELDWEKVASVYKLSEEKQELLQRALAQIRGKELVAYGMTELFPARDGERNQKLLDYLLREAGATYVESLPAMYDEYSSMGLWQFTSFAVHDVPGDRRGASILNQCLSSSLRIPGSVNLLKNEEHARAAYLFAGHNLAELIRRLDKKQRKAFGNYLEELEENSSLKDNGDDLVQYIATAHHLPAVARGVARKWLNGGAKKDFKQYCGAHLGRYAGKTKSNYKALGN